MSATPTTWDAALKQLNRDELVRKTTYEDRPMYAMLPKYERFTGRNMPMLNVYGNPQGRSASFSEAQGNTTSTLMTDFLLDIVSDYSVATMTGEVVDRTRSDKGAFLKALQSTIKNAQESLADAIETFSPLSGTGSIGQVSSGSTVSASTITLEDTSLISNFEVGMTLRGTSTDGGAYDTGEEVLAAVNRSTGVLTATSAAWNTVMSALAASDYLVVSGDAANGSTNVKISGFAAWFPASVTSAAFFGVDRTADSRLYGTYHDGSNQTMEDALIDGQSKSAQQGGTPDIGFINHVKMRRLIKELGASKEYTTVNATGPQGLVANVGFRGVLIQGDKSVIKMVAANKVPGTKGYLLEQKECQLFSIGPAVKFLDEDGAGRILRQGTADGYETRIGGRFNFCNKNPIGSVYVLLPS
jgi:hypothetical protein